MSLFKAPVATIDVLTPFLEIIYYVIYIYCDSIMCIYIYVYLLNIIQYNIYVSYI